jgi:hypothetical protein
MHLLLKWTCASAAAWHVFQGSEMLLTIVCISLTILIYMNWLASIPMGRTDYEPIFY